VYELCGVWVALNTYAPLLAHRNVVMFVVNKAALNMMIRGYSKCVDANRIVFDAWLLIAASGANLQLEYAPSKLNLADGPSRGKLAEIQQINAVEGEAVWPRRFSL